MNEGDQSKNGESSSPKISNAPTPAMSESQPARRPDHQESIPTSDNRWGQAAERIGAFFRDNGVTLLVPSIAAIGAIIAAVILSQGSQPAPGIHIERYYATPEVAPDPTEHSPSNSDTSPETEKFVGYEPHSQGWVYFSTLRIPKGTRRLVRETSCQGDDCVQIVLQHVEKRNEDNQLEMVVFDPPAVSGLTLPMPFRTGCSYRIGTPNSKFYIHIARDVEFEPLVLVWASGPDPDYEGVDNSGAICPPA